MATASMAPRSETRCSGRTAKWDGASPAARRRPVPRRSRSALAPARSCRAGSIAWVGDCRVYRIGAAPEEPAQLLTVDDTYGHLCEAPPPGGSRDDPARMVGNGAVDAPNVDEVALRGGDMLVLCSDGVHKHVEPDDLCRVLRGSAPLARRCGRLLALARARGSRDDATVLVVRREPRRMRLAGLAACVVLFAALVGAWLIHR